MDNLKISFVQLLSVLTIIVINSALLVGFINFGVIPNLENIKVLSIDIIDSVFLLFAIYVFISNINIPFINYNTYIDGMEMDIDDAIKEEMSYITAHIFTSLFLTAILLTSMYCFYL